MRSRSQAWLRDELILALDLYVRESGNPPRSAVAELSETLRAMPIEPELAEDPMFRNANGVQLKIYNFAAIDPDNEMGGMSHGGRGDQEVWNEFASDPDHLHQVASAIRDNLDSISAADATTDEEEVSEAEEGKLLTRVHRVRERSEKLIKARKAKELSDTGKLACSACGFDFGATYGERGEGFIECHHTRPVSELRRGQPTRIEDLALVCSNCHRMIHVRRPWLTVEQLRSSVRR
jgi:5-methylcytosine-specific restriction enzyme A